MGISMRWINWRISEVAIFHDRRELQLGDQEAILPRCESVQHIMRECPGCAKQNAGSDNQVIDSIGESY